MIIRIFSSFILLLLFLGSSGCSSLPKYPVHSQLLGETINTTVDSDFARYYLDTYLQGKRLKPEYDQQIDKIYKTQGNSLPTRDELKKISTDYSVDFASLFFSDKLMQQEKNIQAQKIFFKYLTTDKSHLYSTLAHFSSYRVLFVPGWNYIDNGYLTGSDLALPRQLISDLGVENHLVLTPSNGSVEASAKAISAAILKYSKLNKKIILVGASAAGPAIHLTLGEMLSKKSLSSVVAWINLGGILQGSPLVDYFEQWPQKALMNMVLWYKGWEHDDVLSMSVKNSRKRFKRLQLAPDLIVFNYLALSLSGNLSHLSTSKYPLIKSEGPNDGLTLLTDVIAPDSYTLISVNSDHYFGEDPQINDKTVAVLKTVIHYLENKEPSPAPVYSNIMPSAQKKYSPQSHEVHEGRSLCNDEACSKF
ncbi:MAG: hypothetical protein HOG41_21915 [Gammaproteobacteria bacterium]|nr:hypothetical protein [Gammaproteobacteria bacterium]MBT3726038.1 hypothetical protein [Gammaproteobacteria bacterium]MBT4196681.1 hypothetical protein [Gammaproteobacteria bacterium]MBT4448504.1 hypothetical protein [Gammaproteobacteria bacterium]MBT6455406.1 hypothetical protein [Gammaproteobacteria bacterium]